MYQLLTVNQPQTEQLYIKLDDGWYDRVWQKVGALGFCTLTQVFGLFHSAQEISAAQFSMDSQSVRGELPINSVKKRIKK